MSTLQLIKDLLVAIRSVKVRANEAVTNNDRTKAKALVGDLIVLESLLPPEVEKLIEEQEFLSNYKAS